MTLHRSLNSILIALLISIPAHSAGMLKQPLSVETIATDLGVPWGMAISPDNTMLISQREGVLSLLDLGSNKLTNISGLPAIAVRGQGGLFDVALSPHYDNDHWIYFSYSKMVDSQAATTLARAKLVGTSLQEWQDLLITQSRSATFYHFGGRISFDNDDHIFLTVGERGVRPNAQNLNNHAGSILRLNLDGSIPIDNPFISDINALDEIWSYGHRNPQGLFFNKTTNKLWEIEHGPRGGDEINLIEAGKNYGWPIISYGKEYYQNKPVGQGTERAGMEQPIKKYVPSIAPSGLIQYSGKDIQEWAGNLLTGSLKSRHLNRVVLDNDNVAIDEQRVLRDVKGRIRNIIEADEGKLYLSTDDGRIIKVQQAKQH